MTLAVEYFHEIPGKGYGNIVWTYDRRRNAAKNGRFPPDHPAAAGSHVFNSTHAGEYGDGEALAAFRARGYHASCFPEGDGISMKVVNGQSPGQVAQDIREIFGWDVKIKRGVTA